MTQATTRFHGFKPVAMGALVSESTSMVPSGGQRKVCRARQRQWHTLIFGSVDNLSMQIFNQIKPISKTFIKVLKRPQMEE